MSNSIRKRDVSSLETCGFVFHFFTSALIILFGLWLVIPERSIDEWDIPFYPPEVVIMYISTSVVCILLSILFLNGAVNARIAPKPDSIDTMWDEHSKLQGHSISTISHEGGLPDIFDIDVGVINDMVQSNMREER